MPRDVPAALKDPDCEHREQLLVCVAFGRTELACWQFARERGLMRSTSEQVPGVEGQLPKEAAGAE